MKTFNTTGKCMPHRDYMVEITDKLTGIASMVKRGDYFVINRARQYGKTTTLHMLAEYLKEEYIVLSFDFQKFSTAQFADEKTFSRSFAQHLLKDVDDNRNEACGLAKGTLDHIKGALRNDEIENLGQLFDELNKLCKEAEKPVVLMIDEIDSAANNQVFLDFLAQLRAYYLDRDRVPTFQSAILAGVYDIRNLKRKIREDEEHKANSPWNIAADFKVKMSFSKQAIAGMLVDYEEDFHTGMDVDQISELIFDYTSGYPFLVSRICKLMDEYVAGSPAFPCKASAWTRDGFLEAVKLLLTEKNTLFESLMGKLQDYPVLRQVVFSILFGGEKVIYSPDEQWIDMAMMFGFTKKQDGNVVIANRLFEMRLYNYFLATKDAQSSEIFRAASQGKTQYVQNGHLNMDLILKKYVEHFDSIYGDQDERFDEEEGRRRFLLYLRPIINGEGNYYIEAETRNERRMDIVVDYHGAETHIRSAANGNCWTTWIISISRKDTCSVIILTRKRKLAYTRFALGTRRS